MTCVIKQCDRPAKKCGLCSAHYKKRAEGDYSIEIRPIFTQGPEEALKFYSKIMPSGCVEWTGPTRGGYGRVALGNGRRTTAHRAAFEIAHGKVDKKNEIHHVCGNTLCINVKHLERLSKFDHINKLKRDERGRLIAHSST